jgi:hypothetical protein
MEVKKEPKNPMAATRRNFFWGQKWKLTPVRPIPSVIRKEKSLTWKHLSKIGRTIFIWTAMKSRQTAEWRTFFFRKNLFFVQKINKKNFLGITKSILHINYTIIGSKNWIIQLFWENSWLLYINFVVGIYL